MKPLLWRSVPAMPKLSSVANNAAMARLFAAMASAASFACVETPTETDAMSGTAVTTPSPDTEIVAGEGTLVSAAWHDRVVARIRLSARIRIAG